MSEDRSANALQREVETVLANCPGLSTVKTKKPTVEGRLLQVLAQRPSGHTAESLRASMATSGRALSAGGLSTGLSRLRAALERYYNTNASRLTSLRISDGYRLTLQKEAFDVRFWTTFVKPKSKLLLLFNAAQLFVSRHDPNRLRFGSPRDPEGWFISRSTAGAGEVLAVNRLTKYLAKLDVDVCVFSSNAPEPLSHYDSVVVLGSELENPAPGFLTAPDWHYSFSLDDSIVRVLPGARAVPRWQERGRDYGIVRRWKHRNSSLPLTNVLWLSATTTFGVAGLVNSFCDPEAFEKLADHLGGTAPVLDHSTSIEVLADIRINAGSSGSMVTGFLT